MFYTRGGDDPLYQSPPGLQQKVGTPCNSEHYNPKPGSKHKIKNLRKFLRTTEKKTQEQQMMMYILLCMLNKNEKNTEAEQRLMSERRVYMKHIETTLIVYKNYIV